MMGKSCTSAPHWFSGAVFQLWAAGISLYIGWDRISGDASSTPGRRSVLRSRILRRFLYRGLVGLGPASHWTWLIWVSLRGCLDGWRSHSDLATRGCAERKRAVCGPILWLGSIWCRHAAHAGGPRNRGTILRP